MRKYKNLLVVMEPNRDHQEALERAAEIARLHKGLSITVLRVVYDFSFDVHIINHIDELRSKADVIDAHMKQMIDLVEPYEKEGLDIETKVVYGRDIGQAIIEESHNGYDAIIKGVNHHGLLDTLFFTPIDWYLLRHANIPVLIVKNKGWQLNKPVVVALDFTTDEKRKLNLFILREAQIFAKATKSEIHLVNSAPVMLPTIMLEVPHYSPEVYAENVVNEHKRRVEEFAKHHNIPLANCHVKDGLPDEVIPQLCKELDAKAVFIGSAGRTGAAAALVGNTCEEIIDYIDADLVVINTKVAE